MGHLAATCMPLRLPGTCPDVEPGIKGAVGTHTLAEVHAVLTTLPLSPRTEAIFTLRPSDLRMPWPEAGIEIVEP